MLAKKVDGHYNYFGITGNSRALGRFLHEVTRVWRKWLDRRSRRGHMNWEPFDLQLVHPLQVRLRGKGRKQRICPLWPRTVKVLRAFLAERGIEPTSAKQLFRNHRGEPLTRFGVRYLLRKYAGHPRRL